MNRPQPSPPRSTRREFAKDFVALAAAPLAVASGPPTARADQPKPADATQAAAEALLDIARVRYGKHLTAEQLPEVRSSLARALYAAERLKKVKLQNGDEPAVIFSAEP